MKKYKCLKKSGSGYLEYGITQDQNNRIYIKILRSLDDGKNETTATFTPLYIDPTDYKLYFPNLETPKKIPKFKQIAPGYDENWKTRKIGGDNNNRTFIEAVVTDYFYKTKRSKALALMFEENNSIFTESDYPNYKIAEDSGFTLKKVKNLKTYWKGKLNTDRFYEALMYGIDN